MAAFCGGSPLTIPPVAMCRFKFRLWKCLRLAERGKTAGGKESNNLICGGHGEVVWALLKHYALLPDTILMIAD